MSSENYNSRYNPEGYEDKTAFEAVKKIGLQNKLYHCYHTMVNVARLAGFEVEGSIILKDRNGDIHDAASVKLQKKQRA